MSGNKRRKSSEKVTEWKIMVEGLNIENKCILQDRRQNVCKMTKICRFSFRLGKGNLILSDKLISVRKSQGQSTDNEVGMTIIYFIHSLDKNLLEAKRQNLP